jgi:hypothetical protein
MTFVIILLALIAAIFGLGAVAARRRRFVGSPADQWRAEHDALDAAKRASGRAGSYGGPSE